MPSFLLSVLSVAVVFVLAEPAAGSPALTLQAGAHAGWVGGPDATDVVAVFRTVFAALPAEVEVPPTENYCYWSMAADGRDLRGNVRLASGRRERGELNFAYAEAVDFPAEEAEAPLRRARVFTAADGVSIQCPDSLSCRVTFAEKTVTFRFHRLSQEPPRAWPAVPGEKFVQRTCDESGLRFLLYYHTEHHRFFWVLDEENAVPEHWTEPSPDLAAGRRTGFVFWVDAAHGGRKVLAAIRLLSVLRNDWYDGPFDQLADNYASQTGIREFMESAWPSLKGRIDLYGNYTDTAEPARVAIHPYLQYTTLAEVADFLTRAKASGDVVRFIGDEGER